MVAAASSPLPTTSPTATTTFAVVALDGVVPVTADTEVAVGRDVLRTDDDVGGSDVECEQRVLQRERHRPLAFGEPHPFERLAGNRRDLDREIHVLGAEDALRVPHQRERAHHDAVGCDERQRGGGAEPFGLRVAERARELGLQRRPVGDEHRLVETDGSGLWRLDVERDAQVAGPDRVAERGRPVQVQHRFRRVDEPQCHPEPSGEGARHLTDRVGDRLRCAREVEASGHRGDGIGLTDPLPDQLPNLKPRRRFYEPGRVTSGVRTTSVASSRRSISAPMMRQSVAGWS